MADTNTIRSLVAPMPGGSILIPGSMIAEVVNFSEPEPFHQGPDWLLGEIRWNGWQLPVVNLALLAGTMVFFGVAYRVFQRRDIPAPL